MSLAMFRRFDTRERDDECNSETSTLRGSFLRSSLSNSAQTLCKTRSANSATRVENEIYKCESFDSSSETGENFFIEDEIQEIKKPIRKATKVDMSPEAVMKRQAVYEKWLGGVIEREKQRKALAKQRLESEIEAKREVEEEKKLKSSEKVAKWMRKKEIEHEKKMTRLAELKKSADAALKKPKELKKALNYDEWLKKKNESVLASRKHEEEQKKVVENLKKCRQSASANSYDKWVRSSSSKAKPVPIGKNLMSLKGSTTQIYINPEPWKNDD